jgi:hypothetical protein
MIIPCGKAQGVDPADILLASLPMLLNVVTSILPDPAYTMPPAATLQVRYTACVATRTLLTCIEAHPSTRAAVLPHLLPPMCLNRWVQIVDQSVIP